MCSSPPIVGNAAYLSFSESNEWEAGTVVKYKCKDKFSLKDGSTEFTSTCQTGGVWTWVEPCLSKLF